MKKTTQNWMISAEYDLKTAVALLKQKKYIYVVFMCHLALEKTLKAVLAEMFNDLPPYTHNLTKLIEMANLVLPKGHKVLLIR